MEIDDLLQQMKANWLKGMLRHDNIADIVARFGDLNGNEDKVQAELDRLYQGDLHLSDLGNAQRMVAQHGSELRYSANRRKWLVWVGTHWQWDDDILAMRRAKRTVRHMYEEAAALPDDQSRKELVKWALASESTHRLQAMCKSAESEESIQVDETDIDQDPFLFNVRNGTIDLRTGEFRKHRRDDFITMMSPIDYDPDATGPLWEKFIDDITAGDKSLQSYLARAIGYSMTANARDDVIFFIYGPGGNGKSTFLNTIRKVIGPYVGTVPVRALIEQGKGSPGHRDELASLAGTRMVLGAEIPDRMKIDMGLIKAFTGGDMISVSRKYERTFNFLPVFKLWLYGNSKPRIPEIDDGTWRRVRMVPFLVQFRRGENEITDMEERLEKELPAVLLWAVNGAVEWAKHGLTDADVVASATREYRADEDVVGQFLEDCCVMKATARVPKSMVYERYKQWCMDNGEVAVGTKTFTQRLRGHHINEDKSGAIRYWDGMALVDAGTVVTDGTPVSRNPIREHTQADFMNTTAPSVTSVPNCPSVPTCAECGARVDYYSAEGIPYCEEHGPGL